MTDTILDLKRGDRFTIAELPNLPVLTFDHLDGMYGYCATDDGQVCHLKAWTPVVREMGV